MPFINIESLTDRIGKSQTRRVKMIARLLLAGLLATTGPAGCRSSRPEADTIPAPTTATQFGGTDLAWIEINIAMDEQLLPLLGLVPRSSGSPGVQALALQVQAFTTAELSSLRALHDQAGLPAVNPHKGMEMPGMVTPQQVTDAQALFGKRFDADALKLIRAHLEQGQNLADSENKSGVEPQTRALALQVLRTRSAALTTLESIH
ncbi:DUF305 domain-containing protein [Actinoplanes sp. KI2]|uniref:DUF305 domain-containing protein n=1 Tax=Actinoplanes sp. KI2 TaxID=2983315 RepID=UPI0021D56C3A|nr:DUF305 domain-containing protein [Actinoplanes sp. KI2]MCU7725113.1 DUF305 domain-containing protein [Actinoplanes sp. KI2]